MTVTAEDIQLSNQLLADAQKNFDAKKFYNTVALCEKAMIAVQLLKGLSLREAIFTGIDNAGNFYSNKNIFTQQLEFYSGLFDKNFADLPEDEIESTGYVVSTFEAVLRCLLNTDSYKSPVFKSCKFRRRH